MLYDSETETALTSERPPALLSLGFVLAGTAALTVDLPLSQWILAGGMPKWLTKACSLSELFAHGLGVGLIAVAIFTLDPARRVELPRVLTAAFGAGLCANLLKLLLSRARPHHFDFIGGVFATFGPWLPLGRGGSGTQGFPSSHAATAVGLAIALAWLYPQGRRLFATLAMLACLQRLAASAHFASDVLIGSAVGYAFASQCVAGGGLARRFDRWEKRWKERWQTCRAEQAPPAAEPTTIPIRSAQSPPARRLINP